MRDQLHQQRSRDGSRHAENQVDCLILAHREASHKKNSPGVCRVTLRLSKCCVHNCCVHNPEAPPSLGDTCKLYHGLCEQAGFSTNEKNLCCYEMQICNMLEGMAAAASRRNIQGGHHAITDCTAVRDFPIECAEGISIW